MNKCIQLVRITREPEIKQTKTGKEICSFSGAFNEKYGDNETTHFFDYVAFGKTAENISKYFSKGQRILIDSKPVQNRWENQEGKTMSKVEFIVMSFDFIENKGDVQQSNSNGGNVSQTNMSEQRQQSNFDEISDSIPF